MNFFNWLGFSMPKEAVAFWVGPNDEDTRKDSEEIENNELTQDGIILLARACLDLVKKLKHKH
jgi:hypothetical protein